MFSGSSFCSGNFFLLSILKVVVMNVNHVPLLFINLFIDASLLDLLLWVRLCYNMNCSSEGGSREIGLDVASFV